MIPSDCIINWMFFIEEILQWFIIYIIYCSVVSGSSMLDHLPYFERDTNYLTRVMVITLHLACLLTRMLEHHTNTEEMTRLIHQSIYKLVKLKIKAKFGRSILHLACCRDVAVLGRYPSCQFPSPHLAEVRTKKHLNQ